MARLSLMLGPQFRRGFLALLVTAATAAPILAVAPARAAPGSPLRIVFPATGDVVNNGTIIQGRFRSDSFHPEPTDRVFFSYAAEGGPPRTIRGPVVPDAGPLTVVWDTSRISGGEYVLRAKFKHDGTLFMSPPITVIVNEQPSVLATARILSGAPPVLEFNAHAKDPEGATSHPLWDFGDGTTGTGNVVQHQFPSAGDYDVSVMVEDDLGGEFTSQHELEITEEGDGTSFALTKTERCGCELMTIKTAGTADGNVSYPSGYPYGDLKDLGPFNGAEGGTKLDLSAPSNLVACRFEVVAQLTPGSAPWKCAEGMRYQYEEDIFDAGTVGLSQVRSTDPRYDSSKSADDPYSNSDHPSQREETHCLFERNEWCDGGFHGGADAKGVGKRGVQPPLSGFKSHEVSRIYMLMQAAGWVDSSWVKSNGRASIHKRFHVKISGPDGTCDCEWSVEIEIDAEGNVTQNGVTNISCV